MNVIVHGYVAMSVTLAYIALAILVLVAFALRCLHLKTLRDAACHRPSVANTATTSSRPNSTTSNSPAFCGRA